MEEKTDQLSERLPGYSVEIVNFIIGFERAGPGRKTPEQCCSGARIGTNYEEGGAQGIVDFVRLQVVLKEIRESPYWLRLIQKSESLNNQAFDEMGEARI